VAPGIRQHCRHCPFDLITDSKRDTAQIGGFHLRQAEIDNRHLMLFRYLGDYLGLADTWRPPQHYRRMLTVLNALKLGFQDGQKLGWAHVSSKFRRPYDASP
jgi:hypothetical protein